MIKMELTNEEILTCPKYKIEEILNYYSTSGSESNYALCKEIINYLFNSQDKNYSNNIERKSHQGPFESKYQIGDKVKIVKGYTETINDFIGSVGVIIDIDSVGVCQVLLSDCKVRIYKSCLIPYIESIRNPKFKVGDVVTNCGNTAVICKYDENRKCPYCIRTYSNNTERWVNESELKKL